jgi:hypothetical protein
LPSSLKRCFAPSGENEIDFGTHQISREIGEPLQLSVGTPTLYRKVPTSEVTELLQLIDKVVIETRIRGSQDPNSPCLPRLLRFAST